MRWNTVSVRACSAMIGISCTADDPVPTTATSRPLKSTGSCGHAAECSTGPAKRVEPLERRRVGCRQRADRHHDEAGVPAAAIVAARCATALRPRRSAPRDPRVQAGCRGAGRNDRPRGWRSAAARAATHSVRSSATAAATARRTNTSTPGSGCRRVRPDSGWPTRCRRRSAPLRAPRLEPRAAQLVQRIQAAEAGADDQHIERVGRRRRRVRVLGHCRALLRCLCHRMSPPVERGLCGPGRRRIERVMRRAAPTPVSAGRWRSPTIGRCRSPRRRGRPPS